MRASPVLVTTIAVIAVLPASASAQLRKLEDRVTEIARPVSPVVAARLARLGQLAGLPDGSFISRINNADAPVTLRNGMTITISGKGFDQRRTLSLIGLFPTGDASNGALLKVIDWSDTRIVAVVPPDQTYLRSDTDVARLSVQVVRSNGILQSLVVRNVRFRVH